MLQRFLDPATLASISSLDLVAKTVVDGFVAGLHRFNVQFLKNGLKRVVNRYAGPALKPQTSAVSAFEPVLSSPRLSPRLRGSASRSIPRSTEALASKDTP